MDDQVYDTRLKRCSRCRRWKPIGCEFYRNGKYWGSWCKTCMKHQKLSRPGYRPCPGCDTPIEPRVSLCRRCRFPARTSWSNEEIAWLAGIFEGEGSWSGTQLALSMTDRDIVERVAALLGSKVNGPYETRRRVGPDEYVSTRRDGKGSYKPAWRTTMRRAETLSALVPRLWPWLGSRRRAQILERLPGFGWLESDDAA